MGAPDTPRFSLHRSISTIPSSSPRYGLSQRSFEQQGSKGMADDTDAVVHLLPISFRRGGIGKRGASDGQPRDLVFGSTLPVPVTQVFRDGVGPKHPAIVGRVHDGSPKSIGCLEIGFIVGTLIHIRIKNITAPAEIHAMH